MTKKPQRVEQGSTSATEAVRIDAAETRTLLARFVSEFVAPQKQEALTMMLRRSPVKQKALDYERYLRSDCTSDVTDGRELLRWLGADGAYPFCFFFHREAFRPASRFRISSLHEAIATSWPGLFVNFDAGRALAVTLDLERFRCDVGRARRP